MMRSRRLGRPAAAAVTAAVWGAIVLVASPARGVTPQTWRVNGAADWAATERDSVGVSSDGTAVLGLASTRVDVEGALTVWDLLPDGDAVLAATGDEGKVYRISASGAMTEAATVIQPEVTCLGRDAAGRVLFGTAPDGVLYRLGSQGAEPVVDTPETYIWRILPAPGGGAYLATGDGGKVYRLDGSDRLSLVGDTQTGHVSGLLADGDALLATTEGPGRLLRVSAKGDITVLYEADESELRCPVRTAAGDLYFLGNEDKTGGGEAHLYRRESTGAVERVWTGPSGYGYDLEAGADGVLYVTMGTSSGPGTVIAVRPGPVVTWVEVFHASEPQVASLALQDGTPRWIGTGGLGRVYHVTGGTAPWGKVLSEVFDAGDAARWGALTLDPGPGAKGIQVRTRSGNTRVADAGWSAWEDVPLTANRGPVRSPGSRFLQWELTLGGGASRLDGVRVAYLVANRAPQVKSLTVTPLGTSLDRGGDRGAGAPLTQQLPGGVRVTFETQGGGGNLSPADDPDAAWARRYRTVSWTAVDPNQDDLRFGVSFRAANESEWRPLAKDLEDSPWVWDSSTVPDGWYQLRVEASDENANAAGEGLIAARTTEALPVDNTPPVVEGLARSGQKLKAAAADASGAVRTIERAFDGGDWVMVFPDDGIADSPREEFTVALDGLAPGTHVVLVRAVDEAGNIGTGRLGFTLP